MSEDSIKANDASDIIFKTGDPAVEVMRLTKNGFVYKGETIDDAGRAYNLFIRWLQNASVDKS